MAKFYATGKLHQTRDYSMFVKDPRNRNVNLSTRKHRELVKSMTLYGWLSSDPMAVYRNGNGDYEIKRGQNRFAIAQKLGIAVYFVVDEQPIDSYELERCGQDAWSHLDIAMNFSERGFDQYTRLVQFSEDKGLPLALSASLLMGTVSFGNISAQFHRGEFVVKDLPYAELVSELAKAFSEFNEKMHGKHLIDALAAVARVCGFDKKRMLTNMKRCASLMRKYSNRDDFLTMLEDIYNYGRVGLVPLKLNAIQAMRDRRSVFTKKA